MKDFATILTSSLIFLVYKLEIDSNSQYYTTKRNKWYRFFWHHEIILKNQKLNIQFRVSDSKGRGYNSGVEHLTAKCLTPNPLIIITSHWSEWPSSKNLQSINAGESLEKGNPLVLLVGVEIDTSAMDNSMKIILKTRNKTTIWPSSPTVRHILWEKHNWKRHIYPNLGCSTIQ